MLARVLIGGLVLVAVVLLFAPSLHQLWSRSQETGPVEPVAPRALAPSPTDLWRARVARPPWLAGAAPALATDDWSSLQAALAEGSPGDAGPSTGSFERELLAGLAALRLGDVDRAFTRLEAAIASELAGSHPLAPEAWSLLAEAAGAAGRRERRLEALEKLTDSWPGLLSARAERARALLEEGRAEEALALVRTAPADAASSPERAALLRVGIDAAPVGSAERRAWAAEIGWRHAPRAPWLTIGSDADWKAEFVAALDRADWPSVLERLEALVVADRASTALPEIDRLLEARPPDGERDRALLLLGRARRIAKQNAKALTAFDRVGDSDPLTASRAHYLAALSARDLKQRAKKRRYLEKVEPAPPSPWRDRALDLLADEDIQEGRIEQARARWLLLSREGESEGSRVDAGWRRAWSFFESGEGEEALAAFTQLSTDFPRHRVAAAGLYWSQRLLVRSGETEEARRRLERLADEHPWDYYGQLAASELGRPAQRPLVAGRADLEAALAELLERAASEDEAANERAAALWRTGFASELLADLDERSLLPPSGSADEAGRWALRVALLGECGRHRAALVELRTARPDWRARHDLPPLAWAGAYPRAFSELVERNAEELELDPALVYALIHQESVFDPSAVSSAGARGLMQIMPATNRTIAAWFKERARVSDLSDPEHNVRYGTAYLKRLLENLEHPELALAGYNAGGTRARRWWKELPEKDLALFVESIPFDETRDYVKAVTSNRSFYAAASEPVSDSERSARQLR